MNKQKRAVCLIVAGLSENNYRLQPWRYLSEVAVQIARQGHRTTIITNASQVTTTLEQVQVIQIPSVQQFCFLTNTALINVLETVDPQVVLWNIGLTSFLHQHLPLNRKQLHIGVFTSPMYTIQQMRRVGWRRLLKEWQLSAIHLLGTVTPTYLLRAGAKRNSFDLLVFQTYTTAQAAAQRFWHGASAVIPPAVDDLWLSPQNRLENTPSSPKEILVGYVGALNSLRGIESLLSALAILTRSYPQVRLRILSRPAKASQKELQDLQRTIRRLTLTEKVEIEHRMFTPAELLERVAACDLLALPFELVPSDAPLSLLEVRALGKPLVTTNVACLPELAGDKGAYLAEPGNPASLARALMEAIEDIHQGTINPQGRQGIEVRRWQDVGREWSQWIERL